MGIDFNEHGYQMISSGGYFSFDCSCCGDCCRNVKKSIMVESLDLYRLAKLFGMEMSEVILQYTETAFLAKGFPVFMLKTKPHMDACVFLKSSRCSVNDAKPRACRTYPLGIGPDDEIPGEWVNFIVSKKQHHFTGQRRRAGDWVDETLTPEDRAFVAADFNYTGEIAKLMKNIGPHHEDAVIKLILYFKYTAYDMTKGFKPQYVRNMEQLKMQLEYLGGK